MTTQLVLSEYILNQSNLLVVISNRYGSIEFISKAVEKLLGYSEHELCGNEWWIRTRKHENINPIKYKILKLFEEPTFTTVVYEHDLLAKNGSTKWIRWEITKISDEQLMAIGQDITDRKKFEFSLKEQILLLNDKNKNITDSILYAQRLQQFILKPPEKLAHFFTDAFVLYLPKDIISGDYYAFYELKDKYVILLADCTGHGVPGAMMSFLAHSILREIVIANHNVQPSDILYKADEQLHQLLNQDSIEHCLDGMDLSVVFIDKNKKYLKYSGAGRPMVIFSKNANEILDFSRDSIGFSEHSKNFFTIEKSIHPNDTFYLFSDGYADQFGGQRNKKLNRKNFLEILKDIQGLPLNEQAAFLEYAHNNWKQQNEQTDDITIIGIKI
ncbi:MAG: hypothetical protein KatS3mg027_1354 [Bacteroidia bacterium]|nr:MAG: hypothetical protein KatS3mg027_1354 [Bacteroidia bacterium]